MTTIELLGIFCTILLIMYLLVLVVSSQSEDVTNDQNTTTDEIKENPNENPIYIVSMFILGVVLALMFWPYFVIISIKKKYF